MIRKKISNLSDQDFSIAEVKQWVVVNLPRLSKLRALVLAEKQTMTVEEFVHKLETWLLLMDDDNDLA